MSLRSLCKNPEIKQYPGKHSIFIMDGAKIHCDKNLVYWLLSLGVIIIFLPAYCPFFNPIEVMFSMLKKNSKGIMLKILKNNSQLFLPKLYSAFGTIPLKVYFENVDILAVISILLLNLITIRLRNWDSMNIKNKYFFTIDDLHVLD